MLDGLCGQEFGPRALGHRSLVAVPDVEEMKRRMNRLKFRMPGDNWQVIRPYFVGRSPEI